ncbi:RuvB-like protein 2 [Tanacetum coccineum]
MLLAGQPGTGKTAIAMGMSKSIGLETPFALLVGSKLFSLEMSKTEALMQAFRKAIGVRIKEETEEQSNLILEDDEPSLLMTTHETEHEEVLLNEGQIQPGKYASGDASIWYLDNGASCKIIIDGDKLTLYDKHKKLLIKVERSENRLYSIRLQIEAPICILANVDNQAWLWHARLGTPRKEIDLFKSQMKDKFEMRDLGLLAYYLGIKVTQTGGEITIKQTGYINKILKETSMTDSNDTKIPMDLGTKLVKAEDGKSVDANYYRSLIGSLSELTEWAEKRITLKVDNISAIALVRNPVFHGRKGEVVEIQIDRLAVTAAVSKMGREATLKTTEMETVYDLGAKMIEALGKDKVQSGDVIAIDKASGKITKLGRSFSRSRDYDAMGPQTKFVQCPDGELQKRKEVVHCVTLHEIDVINSSFVTSDIDIFLRSSKAYNDENGTNENDALKLGLPGICLRGSQLTFVKVTMVLDLSENIIIYVMKSRTRGFLALFTGDTGEIRAEILDIRSQEEDVDISDDAKILLTKIRVETSLRYAINLITSSSMACQKRKGKVVEMEDVSRVYELFWDVKRSKQYLIEYQSQYMFNEAATGEEDESNMMA